MEGHILFLSVAFQFSADYDNFFRIYFIVYFNFYQSLSNSVRITTILMAEQAFKNSKILSVAFQFSADYDCIQDFFQLLLPILSVAFQFSADYDSN